MIALARGVLAALGARGVAIAAAAIACLAAAAWLYAAGRADGAREAAARVEAADEAAEAAARAATDRVDACHDLGGRWNVTTGRCEEGGP